MNTLKKHIKKHIPESLLCRLRKTRRRVRKWYQIIIKREDPRLVIVSFPKSGRTWVTAMLSKYISDLYGIPFDPQKKINRLSAGIKKCPIIGVTHIDSSQKAVDRHYWDLSYPGRSFRSKKVILLVRDPRDVVVSYYNHCRFRDTTFEGSLSEFICHSKFGLMKVITFMNLWVENKDRQKDFMILSYEEMQADPEKGFERVLTFLGLPFDPVLVKASVAFSRFDNLKKLERAGELGSGRYGVGKSGTENSYKVRKGKVGSYKEEMSQEDKVLCDACIKLTLSEELVRYYMPEDR